jgi:hypothetical protein
MGPLPREAQSHGHDVPVNQIWRVPSRSTDGTLQYGLGIGGRVGPDAQVSHSGTTEGRSELPAWVGESLIQANSKKGSCRYGS